MSHNSKKNPPKDHKTKGSHSTATETVPAVLLENNPACLKERRVIPGVCLFLAAIVWMVFGQSLGFQSTHYDDDHLVFNNPHITGGLNTKAILWAFTHTHLDNWHPLTTLSHMLDCQLYGPRPWGHHLSNVLLHCAAAVLLFLAIHRMTGAQWPWRSAFVAAMFAIHPLRAESVAWVSERKDVLSGVFFMLTLLAYARYADNPGSRARYWTTSILFALGLMCKPTLVTLPFVLLLLDVWPLNRLQTGMRRGKFWSGAKPLILEKIPLFVLSACSCAATFYAQKHALETAVAVSFPWRAANAAVAYFIYLLQMFRPVDLAVSYPHPGNALPVWEAGLALLVLAAVSTVSCIFWKRFPWLAVGWLWFLGMLVPMIGLVQVGEQARADRYTYLPQIGLYLMVTWMVTDWGARLRCRQWALGVISAGVILALATVAHKQTSYWHDSESLWNHTLSCTRNNYVAHNSLGCDFQQKRQFDNAIAHFQQALQIKPDYVDAFVNLGVTFQQEGKLDEAISNYQKALRINPAHAAALSNLGNALFQEGHIEEAIARCREALRLNPDYAEAHNNLASALLQQGRTDEAVDHYRTALQINPASAEAHNNLAGALLQHGQTDEAIDHYLAALQINSAYAEAHNNLGSALLKQGRTDEAIVHYRESLRLDPDYAKAHYNIGNALLQRGLADEAIGHYREALRLNPDYAGAHNNIGNALLQQGRLDEAIGHYREALRLNPANAGAYYNIGDALLRQGKLGEAIAQKRKALELQPANATIQNNLAWLLATVPEASLRDGTMAVDLATQASQSSPGWNDPKILRTLAAAYAEAGRFPEAIETANRAIQLAEAKSDASLANTLREHLRLYQAGQPLRD